MSEGPEGVELTGQSSLDISSTLVAEGPEGIGIAEQQSTCVTSIHTSSLVMDDMLWLR